MLSVALSRPGRVLSPNSRSHWSAKQRAVREARGRARLLMLKARRDAEELCLLPEGWRPVRYDVTWFYWGGTGPDADNALASCKAYLDGCADALGVNENVTLELLPYHEYGKDKYKKLGKEYRMSADAFVGKDTLREIEDIFRGYGIRLIKT